VGAALDSAVINQQLDAARLCLQAGATVDRFLMVHAHSYAIHQAAINDDVPMLRLLVEHGAKLDVRDTMWNGTPLDWAIHGKKSAAEAYLRSVLP
jgi:ankyrin repeat protein